MDSTRTGKRKTVDIYFWLGLASSLIFVLITKGKELTFLFSLYSQIGIFILLIFLLLIIAYLELKNKTNEIEEINDLLNEKLEKVENKISLEERFKTIETFITEVKTKLEVLEKRRNKNG